MTACNEVDASSDNYGMGLFAQHQELLRASAIPAGFARTRQYRSVDTKAMLASFGFSEQQQRTPGLLIPLYGRNGKTVGVQYRPDQPRERDGKPVKYETPPRQPNRLDVPPGVGEVLGDPDVDLWITEGTRKADAATVLGLACISLSGVWNWRGTNDKGGKTALPDWQDVALNGRRVVLAFDSDVSTKPQVGRALDALAGYLQSKGARVAVCRLPDAGDGKTGLDDYIAAGHGRDDLEHLVEQLPEPATVLDEQHRGQLRMAERLVERASQSLRYVHGIGWYCWDGARWARDLNGTATRAAIDTIKAAFADLPGLGRDAQDDLLRDIRRAESATGIDGVLRLASSLLPLAVSVDQLDRDPYLLNVANGTLDLRTGELRPHNPDDLCTKVAGTGYDPNARSEVFDTFLEQVMPDEQMRGYLSRVFGHALEGRVTEHLLPIGSGTGSNGKSTLVNVVMAALGDYAIAAEPDLLIDKGNAHPTGQADLLGVRLAVCSESDQGRRLAAATVKRLTGGDRMRARRMRQDYIEWDPSHSIFMLTNHKPLVAGDDPAIWRRLRIVPFDVVVTKPDTELGTRLLLDLPAVLAWMVRGHREWHRDGLAEPEQVRAATDDYRAASDALGRFLDERTISSSFAVVRARELYTAWSSWCHDTGEQSGTEKAFSEAMSLRGVDKVKRNGTMTWLGLMLAAEDDQ